MKSQLMRGAIVTAFALAMAAPGFAQGEKAPDEMTGIDVGEKAPDFSLKDQNGEDKALSDLLEDGKTVALVFYRSANW